MTVLKIWILINMLVLASTLANAEDITIKLSVEQIRVQQQLNDAALKSLGKPAAKAVIILDELYEKAISESQKPQEPKQ
jgi:hypothetical protein